MRIALFSNAILSAVILLAQGGMGPGPGTVHSVGSSSFTLVQLKYRDSLGGGTGGGTCSTSGTTCSVTVSSVGAGHSLIAFSMYGHTGQVTLSSVNGETWTSCPTCAGGQSGNGFTDAKYVLSATGGETSFTCTADITPTGYNSCGIVELSWSGSSVTYADSNKASDTSCTSCAGIALTVSGTNAIFQMGIPAQSLTAISSPYSTNAQFYSGSGEAVSLNTSSGTAPTWTGSPSGTVSVAAIALKGN